MKTPPDPEISKLNEALTQSLSLLDSTLESIQNGILVSGLDFRIIKTNKRFEEMWKLPGEIRSLGEVGKVVEFISGMLADPADFIRAVEGLNQNPESSDHNILILKDGRSIERTSNPLYIDGKLGGRVCSFLDLTDRKRAEEKVKHISRYFQAIIEKASDGVVIVSPEGKFIYISPATRKMFGFSQTEPVTADPAESTHPEEREMVLANLGRLMADPSFIPTLQYRFATKSGEWKWVESTFTNLIADPDVGGIVINFKDITERVNAERALRQSEDDLKDIFQTVKEGIAYVDFSGSIISINPSLEKLLGIPKEAIQGRNLIELARALLKAEEFGHIFRKLQDIIHGVETDPFQVEYNSRVLDISVRVNKESNRITGVVRDITEQKEAERLLILAKEKAEESDDLKTAFLQNISHEIRTPMNSIVGFSKMLGKADLTPDKLKNYIRIIISSSDQLLTIVNDILTISAIETNQEKVNSQKLCVNHILDELLEIFRLHPLYESVSISVHKPLKDADSILNSDKTKITQVLTNLLTNAQKFTHKGSIEFGYARKDRFFEFYVKDTGIGIDPALQEIIFDRFRQANIAIGKEYGGTGLGLAISKGFVELLGGRIWVESVLKKGSSFYFTVPC